MEDQTHSNFQTLYQLFSTNNKEEIIQLRVYIVLLSIGIKIVYELSLSFKRQLELTEKKNPAKWKT